MRQGCEQFDDWLTRSAFSMRFGAAAGLALLSGIALFAFAPQIDLALSKHFFDPERGAFAGQTPTIEALRNAFKLLYAGACAFSAIGLVNCWIGKSAFVAQQPAKWLFVCLCLVVGPGLVANIMFKDQWGRARPTQITEFGGKKEFTPALTPSNQCDRNCSFFSGEASSIFVIFFAAAFAFRRWSGRLVAAGVSAGSIAGLVRISQGGHFFSDVFFAGIAMALTVLLIHILLRRHLQMGKRSETVKIEQPA